MTFWPHFICCILKVLRIYLEDNREWNSLFQSSDIFWLNLKRANVTSQSFSRFRNAPYKSRRQKDRQKNVKRLDNPSWLFATWQLQQQLLPLWCKAGQILFPKIHDSPVHPNKISEKWKFHRLVCFLFSYHRRDFS